MGPLLWRPFSPIVTWAKALVVPLQDFDLCLCLLNLVSVYLTPQISYRALCIGTSVCLTPPSHFLPPYSVSWSCDTNPVKIILQMNLFTCQLSPSVKAPSGRDLDPQTTDIQHLKQSLRKVCLIM